MTGLGLEGQGKDKGDEDDKRGVGGREGYEYMGAMEAVSIWPCSL